MRYGLLPFQTYREVCKTGYPDIRHELASRNRTVSPRAIDNLELLNHVVDSLCELPWHFCVDHCREENGQLHLSIVATDLGRHLDVGDPLNAGFFLQNSEGADIETLACTRIFRVRCENGALLECERGQSFSLTAGQTGRGDWRLELKKVIDRSFCGEGVDTDLARFYATTQQMIVTPYEHLCHLVAQGIISDDEQSCIQSAFTEAADFTMYGLINAVTQVAHSLRSDDQWVRAFEMERLGGEIVRGDHNLPQWNFAHR